MNTSVKLSWEPRLRRLIALVAVLCAVAPTLLYLHYSLNEENLSMRAEAEIYAHIITDQINANPKFWRYESMRFASLLRHRLHEGNFEEHRQLIDDRQELVAESAALLKKPTIHVEVEVYDSGAPTGKLRITRSIRTLLDTSVLIFAVSSLCAMLVFYVLHVYPLQTLRSAFTALRNEKEQATVTLQSIADGVIVTDSSLKIRSLNAAAATLIGKPLSEVEGDHFQDHFKLIGPQGYGDQKSLSINDTLRNRNFSKLRERAILVREHDGREFHLEIKAARLNDDNADQRGLVISCHDITESHTLETQLRRNVQELDITVRYAGVGIVFVREGIIQKVNTTGAEIFGLPSEDIVNQDAAIFLSSHLGYQGSADSLRQKLARNERIDFEHHFLRKDQKERWLRIIGKGIDHTRLSEKGSVWIIIDITRLKQGLEELRSARHKAEEANQFKTEFLAHVSHELRSPLSGIMGLHRLVLETDLTPFQRQHLCTIDDSLETLLQLINNLLDLSKIEAGVMELDHKPFSIESVYQYIRTIVQVKAQEKGLELSFATGEAVPDELIGDELRLSQVLLNLVANAITFTSSGSVAVSCDIVSKTATNLVIRFVVSDTGCGIDTDQQDKIFESFVQASNNVAKIHGGSGLGLSICKNLVELMGGTIQVESLAGKGATFSFTGSFSYSEQHSTSPSLYHAEHPDTGEPQALRILFVDDIPINQTLGKLIFEYDGHKVDIASTGRDALEHLAKGTPYDMIFMDIEMPEMDGLKTTRLIRHCETGEISSSSDNYALLQEVRAMIYGTHIPIIGLTGNVSEDTKEECFRAGMNNYLTKPFERQDMLDVLDLECRGPVSPD